MALDYKLIGERLKQSRIKKGYTQEKLAEIMKVSVAYISRVETGKTNISLKRLNEICGLLDTTEGYVLNGASQTASNYLSKELSTILKDFSANDKDLIYQIAGVISENKNKK